MGSYILRRVLLTIPVLLGITIINFTFIRLAPGDPVSMMIPPEVLEAGGGAQDLSPEWRAEMERRLGLDQPLPIQYLAWLREIAEGNFGRSISTGRAVLPEMSLRPVARALERQLGRTVQFIATDWKDGKPETELNFKFYRQATNKIVGISDETAAFLASFF